MKKSMEKGQEEMKNQIQGVKGKIKEVRNEVQRKIEEIEGKVQRRIEKVQDKVQVKMEEVEEKVQVRIGDLEKRLSELEDRPINFPANPDLTYSRPTVKSLTIDGQTSWTVFKTQFDVVSSANGWNNFVKATCDLFPGISGGGSSRNTF
ncbi:hypothetical protein AVEN_242698-1 [Araneus ventricosus]|uniref:Uncharacterized protein n=1 Tax=Araneus ventricosus TaxID=182803 RepID=A0A4Y2E121_ARAVE|nr:hypothetical protein AVEN_242698-1 [Araneus ventricosus]